MLNVNNMLSVQQSALSDQLNQKLSNSVPLWRGWRGRLCRGQIKIFDQHIALKFSRSFMTNFAESW